MEYYKAIVATHEEPFPKILPSSSTLSTAVSSLSRETSLSPRDVAETVKHITDDIVPALTNQSRTSRYLGFIIGGTLPIAEWADNLVTRYDQNLMVHMPNATISTQVEDAALRMFVDLIKLDESQWKGRTFTTGATASNILGLASGREHVLTSREPIASPGEVGIFKACKLAGVEDIQILTSAAHSSIPKAASVVGLGRGSVKSLAVSDDEPWRLDIDAVEKELKRSREGVVSIIAISLGEVNTGRYALTERQQWERLRKLADEHGAWIHIDGAFGIFARTLEDTTEFATLHARLDGIELADSITIDCHKLLNVPYDCGIFLTRTPTILKSTFINPAASYLSSAPSAIPSPLDITLENSRRFRALPVYAVLHSLGRQGVGAMIARMVCLTRKLTIFLRESPYYDIVPAGEADDSEVFMVVMFQAKDKTLNNVLTEKVNETGDMFITGSSWKGEKASRMAVASWKVDVERDFKVISGVLTAVGEGRKFDIAASV